MTQHVSTETILGPFHLQRKASWLQSAPRSQAARAPQYRLRVRAPRAKILAGIPVVTMS